LITAAPSRSGKNRWWAPDNADIGRRMGSLLDSPFSPVIGACLVTGLALSLLTRLVRVPWPAGLVAPVVFLVAYYLTYAQIPMFPPAGAVNKIFYIVLAAALAGLLYDLIAPPRFTEAGGRLIVLLTASLLIAVWIGLPRFAATDATLLLIVAALVLGGTLLLWRLATADGGAVGALDGAMLLAVLPGVFAPIALFGGSSTSVGLCLGLAVGLAMMALVNLFSPRLLGLTAVLGAGGGLLAVIDTITLITRHIDFLALAVFLAAPFVGHAAARIVLPRHQVGSRIRAVATGVMAAATVVPILIILFLRHESPL
jgi:hypothetical protein